VYRGQTDGGSPVVVASSNATVLNLTANDACVYWSTPGQRGANIRGAVIAAPQP
jgi:hypothetical protein